MSASNLEKEHAISLIDDMILETAQNTTSRLNKQCGNKCHFYETALNTLPNPVFIKNEMGEFVYFNQSYQAYFGVNREFYLNKTVLDLDFLPFEERVKYHNEDLHLIRTSDTHHYESQFSLSDKEVGYALYWSKGFQVKESQERGLIGEIVDISLQKKLQKELTMNANQLRQANEQIEKIMNQDCLTGLYNRRAIEETIPKIESIRYDEQSHISLIMADLDYFKMVNDTFGHDTGDKILVQFASILTSCNRKSDLVCRVGGEEFLIILFHTSISDAMQIAERIRTTAEQGLLLPNDQAITTSIGVAEMLPSETFPDAARRADTALYCAKKSGRNIVVPHTLCKLNEL